MADWKFEDPPDLVVITTRAILNSDDWIAYVSHDEDDSGWQFHGVLPLDEREAAVVGLKNILDLDPSVSEILHLPLGWYATRTSRSDPWQLSKSKQ
jgi:hypothetical protein